MRSASLVACGLLMCFIALAPAQEKTAPTPEPEQKKAPPMRAPLGTLDEVEGKNLIQWETDLSALDPSVREKAITIIPVYGESAARIIPVMIKRLDDEDLGPRVKAIMALGVMEIPDSERTHVVLALANRLETDPQHAAKLAAALSLTRFGEEARPALNALIMGINDKGSWQIRKASIIALRRIGSDKKTGPNDRATRSLLFVALHDPAFEVRVEAIQALGYMDQPRDSILRERVHASLKGLTNVNENSRANDKILAMWAHVSMMALDKVTEEQIKHITVNLHSTELEVKGQAVLCVGTLGFRAKSCIPDMIRMLHDKDRGIAILSCWALVAIGEKDPKVFAAMTELADSKDTEERARAQIRLAIEVLKNSKKAEMTVKDGAKPGDRPQPKH